MAVVDIGVHKLEPHVRRAFEEAWRLSGGQPLSAADLLTACVAIGGSPAFNALSNLLPLTVGPPERASDGARFNLNAVGVERPLADSFSVAKRFFAASGFEVWGRDLVTMALLTRDDPSLRALARKAGTTLDDLRTKWLLFLHESEDHRSAEEWDQWWQDAGLTPVPSPTQTPTAGTAYLLTWNPDRYSESQMSEQIKTADADGSATFGWSSGNNRSMAVGDRVFMLRQGPEPRGLVGIGTVSAPPEETSHWDQSKRAEGKTSLIVQVRWEALDTEPIVDLPTLESETQEKRLWSTPAGGVTIEPAIRDKLEDLWRSAWQGGRPSPDFMHIPVGPRNLIARFDADVAAASDSLDVQRYVDAFARVAVSRELTPPLSVGIFGDWGSGKTFFMDRIEKKITELAGPKHRPDDGPYIRDVCQIRFNAWHFAETDLWASLTSTIFKKLQSRLDGEDDTNEFARLAKRLEIARALREHTETQVQKAGNTLQAAEQGVATAEKKLRDIPPPDPNDKQLRQILKQSFEAGDTLSKLLRQAHELTGDDAFEIARKGMDTAKTTVADAKEVFALTSTMTARIAFWWHVLRKAKLYRTFWFWSVILLVVAILAVVLLAEHLWGIPVSSTGEWAVPGLTFLVGLLGLTAKTLSGAVPVFKDLERMRRSVQDAINKVSRHDRREYQKALGQAVKKKQDAAKRLKEAEASRDRADREFNEALAAAQESAEARLGRFIRGRATSADYEKHLGVSAMVREDFDKLSDLMRPINGPRDVTLPSIDRIVLYIDDLDRCYPPTRVVRVLEAVHLLLAFPLFVVFVGVDSRWVSRSLNRHYDQMLRDEALPTEGARPSVGQEPANSQDFLEKIFQVPFWLSRMQPTAVRRMLDGLITSDERENHQASVGEAGESAEAQVRADVSNTGTHDRQADDDRQQSDGAPVRDEALKADGETESDGEATTTATATATATEEPRISELERQYMHKVAPLMPRTPRAVKRFVNIYRLYKAALSPADLHDFLDRDGHQGNFRAVQILLALVIGTPDLAKAVFEILGRPKEPSLQSLSGLAGQLGESEDPIWETTRKALKAFSTEEGNNLELESLRNIAPWVTRYSLHHMVSAPPDDAALAAGSVMAGLVPSSDEVKGEPQHRVDGE